MQGFDLNVFLADLRLAAGPGTPRISADFLHDLRRTYVVANRPPPPLALEDLGRLGAILDDLTRRERQRMLEGINALENDSPLRCPVSLFGTIEFGRLETAHTRLLAWLFDPAAEHGFETGLLRPLLDRVWNDSRGREPADVRSRAERSVVGGGRTDVWVEGGWLNSGEDATAERWLVVIEAKVDAVLGTGQLATYDKEIERWCERSENAGNPVRVGRVFLTPRGLPPEGSRKEWLPLSFLELAILLWRGGQDLKDRPGFWLLRYYVVTILRDILRWEVPVNERSNPFVVNKFMDELLKEKVS